MARATSSAREIEAEIRAQVQKEQSLKTSNRELAEEVKTYIRSKTPVESGDAAASVQVREVKKPRNGLPAHTVFSDDPMFHMLEYGTKADPSSTEEPRRVLVDGQWVTLTRDTPTEAVAPFGQARARFRDQL